MKTLLRNCKVLTMTNEELISANILIEDEKIAMIGPDEPKADRVIDVNGNIIMPGLINAHTHIAMSLLRNYADDLDFWPWLTEKIWPVEEKLTGDHVYWGSLLSMAEMIESGTTCFCDMYFFSEETIKAAQEVGMRAHISKGLVAGPEAYEKLEEALRLYDAYHDASQGRIKIDLGPHAPYTTDDELLQKIGKLSTEKDMMVHIHLSESEKEVADSYEHKGLSPIAYAEKMGLFDHRAIAAHCVHISPEDRAILARKKVSVINNPSSNLKLSNGFAPIYELLEEGVNVGLGTDGPSSNNNQNMFEEMHFVGMINKAVTKNPKALKAYEVLKMATINGAKALGIEDRVGTLEVGKEADLIMVDIHKTHFYPHHNLISSLVYSAQAADVSLVMVQGKILMEDRILQTIALPEVITRVMTAKDELTEVIK